MVKHFIKGLLSRLSADVVGEILGRKLTFTSARGLQLM